MHVELDEVGADLDRALEGGEGVLRQLGGRSPVGDRPRHSSRSSSGTSILSTRSSAPASRSRAWVPRTATTCVPAAFADATPASVSSKTSVSPRGDAERFEREQVALRIGLAAGHVVVGDHGREQICQPGRGDDRIDLLSCGAGDDREPRPFGGEANRVAHRRGHRRPVGDDAAVAVDPFPDEDRSMRVAGAEAQLGDRVLGQSGESLVVVAVRDRRAVLGEELAVDPAEDGLVPGERAVEVEDHRADRHSRERLRSSSDAGLRTPARPRGGVRARALEHPARTGARSRGGDGGRARGRGGRLRPGVTVRLGARTGGLALSRSHELPAAPLLRPPDHCVPEGRGVGGVSRRPRSRAPGRPRHGSRRARVRHLVGAGGGRRPRRARRARDPRGSERRRCRGRPLRARDRGA